MIQFVIVHYNTPELITANIASIIKNHNDAHITVFENSDKAVFANPFGSRVTIIDNTKGQLINFTHEINKLLTIQLDDRQMRASESKVSNFGTFKHSLSIQYCLDNLTHDFILLDSDILLTTPVDHLCNDNYIFISDIQPQRRILPFIAYLNRRRIYENNITFCDYHHILPVQPRPDFDTGGWFYTQVVNQQLPYCRINYNDYVVHYGNGSWKDAGVADFPTSKISLYEWLHIHHALYKLK